MTVTEAARIAQVSRQAIYSHLNKVDNKGRDDKTGEISAKGLEKLSEVYPSIKAIVNPSDSQSVNLEQPLSTPVNDRLTALQTERDALQEDNERLTGELKKSTDKCTELQTACEVLSAKLAAAISERDYLREQLDKCHTLLLPPPATEQPAEKKRGLFGWLMRK